jgi:tRNA A-37 threonylcarbamoyl transferase component Bud32
MNYENVVATRSGKKIYREADKLVKLFDESYSVSSVLNEALNQARIMETGLNIPSLQEVSKIDGKWLISMDFIEGKTLEDLIKENPEKTDEFLKIFVDAQVEIHSKKSTLLRKLHDKMESKIDKLTLSDSVKFDLKTKLAGHKKHNKVLHGDYQLSNVIVGMDGKVYVIDWAHATQGNASADAAMSYLLMKLNKKDGLAEKYLEMFCAVTNTDKHYVQTWIPIVAASHLEKYQGDERIMLESFINVVEY